MICSADLRATDFSQVPMRPTALTAMGRHEWPLLATAVATTALGLGLALVGGMPLAMLLAVPVLIGTVLRPAFGAYLFLLANPLIVGIARGDPVPLLRPNEILLLLLLLAFVIRLPARVLSGGSMRPNWNVVDTTLVLLTITGSLLPLAWREVRSLPVTSDDLLYTMVLWKYLALYWLFRQSIATPAQVVVCLVASMGAAAIVGIVAILQVNNLLGVPGFLFRHYDAPFTGWRGEVVDRGTSTIASSFGTADVMIMNLLIALGLLRAVNWRSWLLSLVAALFLFGCVAAGAFSGIIGLAVALVTFAVIARQTKRMLMVGPPIAIAGAFALWPVIAGRLEGFGSSSGLPPSWVGRWANLRDFFLPEILSGWNWLTGVRPAARVPAPESWRDWVYIESGYLWLVWIGGLPFLLAFIAFATVAGWRLWLSARRRIDVGSAAATAALAYLLVIVVLMLLDPHLTIRGSADLFFPLLAVAAAHWVNPNSPAVTSNRALGR